MSIRTVITLFLCVFGVVFLAVNWSGIMAPVSVNLLYTQIQAPLGLIVLVVLGTLLVACVLWSLMQQAAVLVDIRKANKEAQANKRLAEHAEQSRLETLAQSLTQSMAELNTKLSEAIKTQSEAQSQHLSEVREQLQAANQKIQGLDEKLQQMAAASGVEFKTSEPVEEKQGFFTRLSAKHAGKAKTAAPKAEAIEKKAP